MRRRRSARRVPHTEKWVPQRVGAGRYERAARAERKSALQGSGLVRTVGPCAQRRVIPHYTRLRIGQNCRAVCTKERGLNASGHNASYRDALSNDRRESAARVGEKPTA